MYTENRLNNQKYFQAEYSDEKKRDEIGGDISHDGGRHGDGAGLQRKAGAGQAHPGAQDDFRRLRPGVVRWFGMPGGIERCAAGCGNPGRGYA